MKKFFFLVIACFAFAGIFAFSGEVHAENSKKIYVTVIKSDGKKKKFTVKNKDYNSSYIKAFEYADNYATDKTPVTIKLPKCTLDQIFVHDYFHYDFTSGTTVKSGFCSTEGSSGKYTGLSKFSISGGTFSLGNGGTPPIRIAHARNIKFEGVKFKYSGSNHTVEFAACKNISFIKCSFIGSGDAVKKSGCEALQIDILDKNEHFTDAAPYDGTCNNGVTVDSCSFKGVSRGVGTRTPLVGYYQKNIKIKNCKFNGLTASGITLAGAVKSSITNNTITDCGEGIVYYAMVGDGSLQNVAVNDNKGKINKKCEVVISGNKISVKKTDLISQVNGINISGNVITSKKTTRFPEGDYCVGGIIVKNNTIKSAMYGIRLFDTKNSTVTKNTINLTGEGQNGIYMGVSSDNNTVTLNDISGSYDSGFVINSSSKNVIKQNTITSPKFYGINMTNQCKKNYVTKNKISKSGNCGITIQASTCAMINTNTITSAGSHGICVMKGTVVDDISGNKITGSKLNGLYIDKTSTFKKFSGNNIKTSGAHGMCIEGKVSGLSGNTFSSNKKFAIVYTSGIKSGLGKNTFSKNGSGNVYPR